MSGTRFAASVSLLCESWPVHQGCFIDLRGAYPQNLCVSCGCLGGFLACFLREILSPNASLNSYAGSARSVAFRRQRAAAYCFPDLGRKAFAVYTLREKPQVGAVPAAEDKVREGRDHEMQKGPAGDPVQRKLVRNWAWPIQQREARAQGPVFAPLARPVVLSQSLRFSYGSRSWNKQPPPAV